MMSNKFIAARKFYFSTLLVERHGAYTQRKASLRECREYFYVAHHWAVKHVGA